MTTDKKVGMRKKNVSANQSPFLKIVHAMRNGKLYRSIDDGITWELEEDEMVDSIPEGTSRVTYKK